MGFIKFYLENFFERKLKKGFFFKKLMKKKKQKRGNICKLIYKNGKSIVKCFNKGKLIGVYVKKTKSKRRKK